MAGKSSPEGKQRRGGGYPPWSDPARARARRAGLSAEERKRLLDDFDKAVNLTASELRRWLATEASNSVGHVREGEQESVGHRSGRRIVALLGKKRSDYTDDDLAHMRKVRGYIQRHLAQRPRGDVSETRWRYSLMNWGHDPLKRGEAC
jgi:hypothetical protein